MIYKQRFWIFALIDSFMILTAILYGTFLINASVTVGLEDLLLLASMVIAATLCSSMVFKLYKKAWEYASIEECIRNSQPIDRFIQDYPALTNEHLKKKLFMLTDYNNPRATGLVMEG